MSQTRFNSKKIQWVVAEMVFCVNEGGRALCAVNANWNGDGWNLNANSVDNPNRWNDGYFIFSPQMLFFSRLFAGSFTL